MVEKKEVNIPASSLKSAIASVMQQEGYIESFSVAGEKATKTLQTNEMKRMNYTENANERTHDARNERTIHETNARYTNERIIGA
jgi:ribosomal protein S8